VSYLRILVADISGPDTVRPPVAEFLGISPGVPPPDKVIWRGHEVFIRHGISIEEATTLKPDFIFALMGWHGIDAKRSKFYEHFFNGGVPVFTWGNDSVIPRLMAETMPVRKGEAPSRRIVFRKPDHPILKGVLPEMIRTSGDDSRTLVKGVRGDIGLAYDPDNASWEIIYLEDWFGNHRWLHYHPHPSPPPKLIDNFLSYMTRPKERMTLAIIGGGVGATTAGLAAYLPTGKAEYGLTGATVAGIIGAILGWILSE
jgi:hypothetical protein